MPANNQFADTFLQEAADQLALVEEIVLGIEENPRDTERVNRLFRVFHTIKGSGAMFGFDEVAAFTHHIETALDKVRSGALVFTRELVDFVLAAKDQISEMLECPATATPESTEARSRIVARLGAIASGQESTPASPVPMPVAHEETSSAATTSGFRVHFRPEPGIMARGIDPASLLADLRSLGPCVVTADTSRIPPLEQLTADDCHMSWIVEVKTDQDINAIKDVFIFVEDDSEIRIEPLVAEPASASTVEASRQSPVVSPSATTSSKTGRTPLAAAHAGVAEKPAKAGEFYDARPVTGAKSATPAEAEKAVRKAAAGESWVRVPSDKLDRLVNLVGELVINQSRLAQLSIRLDTTELAAPTEDLERLVAELRDTVLGIRMMPIGTTFSRFKRLVRDLSAELGKEIDLITEGAETELDKTVLDQLGDPLVHLIRNSIDHGINTPEERLRAGKPRRGVIRLAASHEGAHVIIKIEDDGQGLDKEAIRAKAVEKKLIGADANLTDSDLYNLIFLPGFSTAKAVTSVSGRGVGMDVVKRQIDALRGSVAISSQPGRGTSIALTLPLTLAIIDGLLVELNREPFILPMSMVTENVELTASQRASGNGRNVLAVRGELVPYLRLRELFSLDGEAPEIERVVIVNLAGNRVGLVVDQVLGSHQTVIQSLGRFYRSVEVVSGATIMGDGRVALILDVAGLVRLAGRNAGEAAPPPVQP